MTDKIIKSAERVKNHGEVFTPKKTVDFMLDQPEISAKVNSLTATFLEPSAGEGAFLTEILHRKLLVAQKQSNSARKFGENCLIALSSLYGIELLEDNVEMLVMNMITTFNQDYLSSVTQNFSGKPDAHVLASAKVIIQANMVQGDALKKITSNGTPIIFSEWRLLPPVRGVRKVQRMEYTFESIVNGKGPTKTVKDYAEEIDLFADSDFFKDEKKSKPQFKHYVPVKITDIYKQLVE